MGPNLDARLTINDQITEKIGKARKGIGFLCKLQYFLLRSILLTTYKSFVGPHLDYEDVTYDQPSNRSFSNKTELVEYYIALVITRTIGRLVSRKTQPRTKTRASASQALMMFMLFLQSLLK